MTKRYEISDESDFCVTLGTYEAVDEARAVFDCVHDQYEDGWSDAFELYAREVGSDEVHSYDVHARMTLTVDVRRVRQ